MTMSCAAFCVMARFEEEGDTAAADAADAERASSMMRKWDLPPRLLCVYHYSASKADGAVGADVTYLQPIELAYNATIQQGNCWWRWGSRSWCVYYTPSAEAILSRNCPT